MNQDQVDLPVFGSPAEGVTYQERPAAYAVVKNGGGKIAVVGTRRGYFLPGGGALPGETPAETVIREVREELARSIKIDAEIGHAIQYFFADERHYRMHAVFFAVTLTSEPTGSGEHRLFWLDLGEFERAAYHQCHVWAARQFDNLIR